MQMLKNMLGDWKSLLAIGLGAGLMIGLEIYEEPDLSISEILLEMIQPTLIVIVAVGMVRMVDGLALQREQQVLMARDIAATRREGVEWRDNMRDVLQGLSVGIQRQFEDWGLTSAESEVGLLILKGLSYKEIATVRDVNEKTVRQQAHTLFRKAHLNGRAALSAFFLEDLLLPSDALPGQTRRPTS